MEITEFGELNALNKLLGKIKFQQDLDFSEFKEFVGSPFIANIFKRVNEEYYAEVIKLGHIRNNVDLAFKFDSPTGKILSMRIDELTDLDKETLVKNGSIDTYLEILISPLDASDAEFGLLRDYFTTKLK
jgi:hypothetical protein